VHGAVADEGAFLTSEKGPPATTRGRAFECLARGGEPPGEPWLKGKCHTVASASVEHMHTWGAPPLRCGDGPPPPLRPSSPSLCANVRSCARAGPWPTPPSRSSASAASTALRWTRCWSRWRSPGGPSSGTSARRRTWALTAVKELWGTYLEVVDATGKSGPLADVLLGAMLTTLERMDEDWYRRFPPTLRLIAGSPALEGHVLRHCAETQAELVRRRGVPDRLELRLLVEFFVAAWRCALDEWLPDCPPGGELPALLRRSCSSMASSLALEV
jgi:hypothetical protein